MTPIVVYLTEDRPAFRPTIYDEPKIDREKWRDSALANFRSWFDRYEDRAFALEAWIDAYIDCGPCKAGFKHWCQEHPIGQDLDAWCDEAKKAILKNEWL